MVWMKAHDSRMVIVAKPAAPDRAAAMGAAEQRYDGAEAGERGGNREHEDAELPFVLDRGAAAYVAGIGVEDDLIGGNQVKRDADIPADQQARRQRPILQ